MIFSSDFYQTGKDPELLHGILCMKYLFGMPFHAFWLIREPLVDSSKPQTPMDPSSLEPRSNIRAFLNRTSFCFKLPTNNTSLTNRAAFIVFFLEETTKKQFRSNPFAFAKIQKKRRQGSTEVFVKVIPPCFVHPSRKTRWEMLELRAGSKHSHTKTSPGVVFRGF